MTSVAGGCVTGNHVTFKEVLDAAVREFNLGGKGTTENMQDIK